MPEARPKRARMQLEDLLLRHGAVDDAQLKRAREEQKSLGGDLGRHLVDLGFISEDLLLRALAHQMEIPLVDPELMPLRAELLQALPVQICERYGVIAVDGDLKSKRLRVATSDPGNRQHLVQVEQATGLRLEPAAATTASIEAAVRKHYYGEAMISTEAKGPTIDFAAQERALAEAESRAAAARAQAAGAGTGSAQLGRIGMTKRIKQPAVQQPAAAAPAEEIAELEPIEELPEEPPAARPHRPPAPKASPRRAPPAEPPPEELPEVSIEPELPPQVSWAEVQALAQRIERIEAFVTQPQFAAMMARVERLEQIASQLAQALRVVGGVLIDSQLITLDEYRARTGLK